MATSSSNPILINNKEEHNQYSSIKEEAAILLSSLPTERAIPGDIYQYQGYWLGKRTLTGCLISQKYYEAQPTNVILASQPKCGTTWLKALLFTILNRKRFDFATHPLLSSSPHDCVPSLEHYFTSNLSNPNPTGIIQLLATHIPFALLPNSIKISSGCPIVYIARDPKDAFVSSWNFICKLKSDAASSVSLEELFDKFCKGISGCGPCWKHILEYWKASLEFPSKVMFLKYEDLKNEPLAHVKRMAEFVGHPFSEDEEEDGVIQKVTDFCSFENLKNLEVNQGEVFKPNSTRNTFMNHVFFGQGKVGGYKDLLTEDMIKRIDYITDLKLKGSGLVFK